MFILDRYILWLYAKVMLVSLLSVTGLFVVIDCFGNLEELLTLSKSHAGGLLGLMFEYYGARSLTFLDRTSPVLCMMAALFALTWMDRTNEMTAILAAGVPRWRMMIPLILATVLVSGIAVVNREVWIPAVKEKLTRNAQSWDGTKARALQPKYDNATGVLLGGKSTLLADASISAPVFRLPSSIANEFHDWQIIGEKSQYVFATETHPAGYLVNGVTSPGNLKEKRSVSLDGEPVIFVPGDSDWLGPEQAFVASNVTFRQLSAGNTWRQYSSTWELVEILNNPSLDAGADVSVKIHSRILQPFLDVTLLMLALPLVVTRRDGNVLRATGGVLVQVSIFFIIVMASQALGGSYLLPPVLAAWLPLIIFIPIATWLSPKLCW